MNDLTRIFEDAAAKGTPKDNPRDRSAAEAALARRRLCNLSAVALAEEYPRLITFNVHQILSRFSARAPVAISSGMAESKVARQPPCFTASANK